MFGPHSQNQEELTISFISRRKFIFLFFEEAVRIWSLCEVSYHLDCNHGVLAVLQIFVTDSPHKGISVFFIRLPKVLDTLLAKKPIFTSRKLTWRFFGRFSSFSVVYSIVLLIFVGDSPHKGIAVFFLLLPKVLDTLLAKKPIACEESLPDDFWEI